jgi:zinc transport system substrate-binding protein
MSTPRAVVALASAALAGALALAGCGDDSANNGRPSVVVSFYPLQFVVENLAGDAVDVTNLTAPGVEPHDLELTPQAVGDVADADLVVYLSGFQPAVDDAVDGQAAAALDVADAADLSLTTAGGTLDPHFWLDPSRLAAAADATATTLVDQGILDADTASSNLAMLTDDLDRLDAEFRNGLADCTSRDLVTSHEAFGYLADAYDLTQVGITGLSPEAEPDPQDLADVTAFVEQNDVRTIYYETLVSPDVAETVARETGAEVAVLDPLEGLVADATDDDYLTVMSDNLETLRTGQGCR